MLGCCLAAEVVPRQQQEENEVSYAKQDSTPEKKRRRSKTKKRKSSARSSISSDRSLHDAMQPLLEVPVGLESSVEPEKKPQEQVESIKIEVVEPSATVPSAAVEEAEDQTQEKGALIVDDSLIEPLRKGFVVKKINSFNKRTVLLWINDENDKLFWGTKRDSAEKSLELGKILDIQGSTREDVPLGAGGESGSSRRASDSLLAPPSSPGCAPGDLSESEYELDTSENKAESSAAPEKSKTKAPKDAKNLREFKLVIESKAQVFRTKNAADRAKIVQSIEAALERFHLEAAIAKTSQ